MDFVFMLTREDRTVADALDVVAQLRGLGVAHVGFKDIGLPEAELPSLHDAIRALGATTYLEVVSTTPKDALRSAEVAAEIGVDHLLGGTDVAQTLEILDGTDVAYLPFVGRPEGHPTRLGGSARDVAEGCRRAEALGCAGVDLLAYRATEAAPLDLVHAARQALSGRLLVAGSVESADQVTALTSAGADAFTVGSAAFAGRPDATRGTLSAQLRAVQDWCADANGRDASRHA